MRGAHQVCIVREQEFARYIVQGSTLVWAAIGIGVHLPGKPANDDLAMQTFHQTHHAFGKVHLQARKVHHFWPMSTNNACAIIQFSQLLTSTDESKNTV